MRAVKHKPTGLWYRPDKWGDCEVLRHPHNEYKDLDIRSGDIVLDAGGHIGAFTWFALQRGAALVHSYEPEPGNFVFLQRNFVDDERAVLHKLALMRDDGEIDFFLGPTDTSGYSAFVHGKRKLIKVKAVSFQRVLEEVQFNVVKLDIEGAEYEVPLEFPKSVRSLAIEFHLNKKMWRAFAPLLVEKIEAQGFKPTRAPVTNDKRWDTVGIWRR